MSLDNVLAVAAIADGDSTKLIVGLGLARVDLCGRRDVLSRFV